VERRATGKAESLGRGGLAAHDAPDRRLDRQGIRRRLPRPLGTDRAAEPAGARISQAGSHPAQTRRGKAEGFYRELRKLLNSLGDDEAVVFADAVHPTHAARPVGCWAPKQDNLAIEQTSGRQRINIHGAIDLETGQTRMIEAETIDALSTIRLLES